MYLAMARVAHREGYPEIGLYYEKAAWEEALCSKLACWCLTYWTDEICWKRFSFINITTYCT